jgi:hypothetical protein
VKIPSVTFEYCTVEDHSKEMKVLKEGLRKCRTLIGTQKMHFIIPASKNQVQTKVFPEVNVFNTTYLIHLQDEEYQVEDIRGYVTCTYDRKWWSITSK